MQWLPIPACAVRRRAVEGNAVGVTCCPDGARLLVQLSENVSGNPGKPMGEEERWVVTGVGIACVAPGYVGIGPVQLNGHDRVAVGKMADHQMLLAGPADERRWFRE